MLRLTRRLSRFSYQALTSRKSFSTSSPERMKIIEQEFDRVDINKDGVISREEFFKAYGQTGVSSLVKEIIDASGWPTCSVNDGAKEVAKTMREQKTGWLVVTGQSEDLQGIITEKDIVQKALCMESGDITAVLASEIMTPKDNLITVSISDSVWDLTRIFIEKNIRAAPVLDADDKLVGFVSVQDAVAQLVTDHSSELISLNAYINGSY
mmetsp:Transcript_15065/g.22786  ORF Transcript_15065/g.22786 Transcript_15065/m.22786 type:complete len:210 (-) Transcript_15065:237-866(-)|eukprot:CAMPEP_0167753378 /NCGR_PEP_ID=MMETSP0110_2-20121227/7679_1 /TAXON_ID=629695 /ORGANISM="Gymnochlora sp., Strain CCMP2014" /LENGTH=209 /DNA_ID=CAMNT_0007639135 /DNA_START=56 /DNA_END=685 /DNA_ORIENTATION=-